MLKVESVQAVVDALAFLQDKPLLVLAVLFLASMGVVGMALYVVLHAVRGK